MNKKVKILIVIIVILLLAIGYLAFYLNDYYHAEKKATDFLNNSGNVSVSKEDYGLFLNGSGNDTLLIFYPGAKVEYVSYLPLLSDISSRGVDCALVEMPFNIAFLGQDRAGQIIDSTNYSRYVLAGHSLGGVSAVGFQNHTCKGDAVVLLASYPSSKVDVPVLSIYGNEDKVFDMKSYNESKTLMGNLTEYVIDGGNHGQFAYYGAQDGDGQAKITPENQQKQTSDEILRFINSLN